MLILISYSTCY